MCTHDLGISIVTVGSDRISHHSYRKMASRSSTPFHYRPAELPTTYTLTKADTHICAHMHPYPYEVEPANEEMVARLEPQDNV